MANVLVEESSLQAIADAIRYKTGGTDTYKPREMAPAIRNLPGTGVLQNLSVTENGNYTPGAGVDGYDFVSVAVPNSALSSADEGKVVVNGALMPQTSLSVTANGTYDTTDKNSVTVNISGENASITYSTQAPSGSGNNGTVWVHYANSVNTELRVTGGYNGGAVITLTVDGDEVYRATGSSPYNASYAVNHSVPGPISVAVIPPPDEENNHVGDLIIVLTGPSETKTYTIQPNGSNTSYGYDYSISTTFSADWIKDIYIWKNSQWAKSGSVLSL